MYLSEQQHLFPWRDSKSEVSGAGRWTKWQCSILEGIFRRIVQSSPVSYSSQLQGCMWIFIHNTRDDEIVNVWWWIHECVMINSWMCDDEIVNVASGNRSPRYSKSEYKHKHLRTPRTNRQPYGRHGGVYLIGKSKTSQRRQPNAIKKYVGWSLKENFMVEKWALFPSLKRRN